MRFSAFLIFVFTVANAVAQPTWGVDEKGTTPKGKKADAYAEIEAAVKAGKLTKEEAAAKLAALKQASLKGEKGSNPKGKKGNAYAEIEAAVKAGKLTKEEAAAKLAALKQASLKGEKGSNPKGKKGNAYAEIEAAVKAGKLTKEEAQAKLVEVKRAAAAKTQKDFALKHEKTTNQEKTSDHEAIARKLSELVKQGLISNEQAKAMMAAARKVSTAKKTD